MQEFLKLKDTDKSEYDRSQLQKEFSNFERNNMKSKNIWGTNKEKMQQSLALEKAESYEEAFAKIEAATGIHDIDLLVKNFI